MSTILLSNNTLSHYQGSELVTLEIAQYLREQGHEISVATFASGGGIKDDFDHLDVRWIDLSKPVPDGLHFDLLWGHHFTCFDALLLDQKVDIDRAIFSSLSPYMALECPPLYAEEMTALLANSHETRETLEGFGIRHDDITVMPNCVTQAWVDHIRDREQRGLRSVAVVSHHLPPEIAALAPLLKKQSVDVTFFGMGRDYRRITPELLSAFDAVVTIGRTTQAALALEIPVYCYDRFGGPGYLTRQNFSRAAHFNFSGRCCNRRLDAQSIATELTTHFDQVMVGMPGLAATIRNDFYLPSWVDRVMLDAGKRPTLPSPPVGKIARARRLRSLKKPDDHGSSTESWLHSRRATRAQRKLIDAHLSTAAPARIGIVVWDRSGDENAIAKTLDSLAPSNHDYRHIQIHVVSPRRPTSAILKDRMALARWHCVTDTELVAETNSIAGAESFEWILQVDAGAEFTRSGLQTIAIGLLDSPDIRGVYGDDMMRTASGLSALLRPDFNLDLMLSMPAGMATHWLFRRDVFLELGGFDADFSEAPEFALVLQMIDVAGIDGLAHVHEPLFVIGTQEIRTRQAELDALRRHLRNRGYTQAVVESPQPGCYRIGYGHAATPGVSILIPTRNQFYLLQRCIESVLEKTAYGNYEVLIIDNGSTDSDACTWLQGIDAMDSPQLRVLRYPQPFDHSAMINLAARNARGDYLLLLDNDIAILREDWLDALLNHAQRPEVGIVGAKLLNPDGTVQHAGTVLGLHGPAGPAFSGEKLESPGYMHRLQVDQNYSAVSGSCLMVRKAVFDEVGGLESGPLRNAYNDVDLCLKVRQAGYLVVWTPNSLVLHEGGASQVREDPATIETKASRRIEAQDAMYAKWLPVLANDPAYNRNLSLNGPAFQVETETTFNWNPLPWRPLPVALTLPADRFGCGHYRILQPAAAMNDFGIADVRVGGRYCTPVEMERLAPDVVVLQRQMLKSQLEPQKRMLRFSRSFKVAELDDYLPNVPMKSAHKGQLPSDVLKTMRDALKLVDRFVVSTAPLAEALDGLHPDIRVVENRLPLPWWGAVKAQRRQGQRPRVGWGGGSGHRGDLELIADVVRELADEVEWVLLGMCPDKLRPYVHEFHPGVAIEDYPARLAGLDLDLALAPLEDNLFNRCKSNLRLLEYGACGYPVVCSDVTPYRGDLPVTRVKPRFRDWVEAIRMHTQDLDAAARAGDALRAAVHRDWMLDDAHAALWLSQWLPD